MSEYIYTYEYLPSAPQVQEPQTPQQKNPDKKLRNQVNQTQQTWLSHYQSEPLSKAQTVLRKESSTVKNNIITENLDTYKIDTQIKLTELVKTFSGIQFTQETDKYGKAESICGGGSFLIIGTNLGYVLCISQTQVNKFFLPVKKQFICEICTINHGSVCAMTLRNNILGVGYSNGSVGFFDIAKNQNIKWIRCNSKILTLKFITDTILIGCNEDGETVGFLLEKGIFSYDLDMKVLFTQEDQPFITIKELSQEMQQQFLPEANKIKLVKKSELNSNDLGQYKTKDGNFGFFVIGNGHRCLAVRIQSLEKYQVLFEIKNEQVTSKNQCLLEFSIWNNTKLNEEKEQLILFIGWQKVQKIVSVTTQEVIQKPYVIRNTQFYIKRIHRQPTNIIFLQSICRNLLLILTEGGVVHTYNFVSEKANIIQSIPQEMFQTIPQTYMINKKAASAGLLKAEQMRDSFQMHYHNTVTSLNDEIYYLTPHSVQIIKTYQFQEIFRHILEQNDYFKSQQLLLCVHNQLMWHVDQALIDQSVGQVGNLYLFQIFRLHQMKQVQEAKDRFYGLTHFLLDMQAEAILFTDIAMSLEKYLQDEGQFFYNSLRPFILLKMIKYIPDASLLRVIKHYETKQDIDTLEQLFYSLDYTRINKQRIMQCCLENCLFKPLINICTFNNEYMTPLFQIWNYSLKCDDKLKSKEYAYSALAYIIFILEGKTINGEMMQEDVYDSLIEMITCWIFEPTNLNSVITIEPFGSFKIFFRLCELIHSQEILQESIENINKISSKYVNHTYRSRIAVMNIMESQIKCKQEGNSRIERAYTLFIIKLLFRMNMKLNFDIILQAILYICFNISTLFNIEADIMYEAIEEEQQNHQHFIEYLHQRFMLKMIMKLEAVQDAQNNLHQNFLAQLGSYPVLSEFQLVSAHLFFEKQEYIRPFELILKSSNPIIKASVFNEFTTILSCLQEQKPEQFSRVNAVIVERLTELLKIDVNKTRNLIAKFQGSFEKEIILKLKSNPKLQLEYIEHIIKQEGNVRIDNEILKEHIVLLNQLEPERVLKQLKSNNYPLDDVLEICKQYKQVEAVAYIYERTGSIFDAIQIHIELLEKTLENIVDKLDAYDQVETELYNQMEAKINEIVAICKKNSNYDNAEDNWYTFLDKCIQFFEIRLDKMNFKLSDLRNKLLEYLGQIIEDISMYTSLDLFATSLEERYSQLDLAELKHPFIKILNNFYYQVNFILNIKEFIREGFTENFNKIYSKLHQGYFVGAHCDICHEQLNEEVCVFFCGHVVHFGCNLDQVRCKTCLQSDFNIYEKIVQNKMTKLNKLISQNSDEHTRRHSQYIVKKSTGRMHALTDPVEDKKDCLSGYDTIRESRATKLIRLIPQMKQKC